MSNSDKITSWRKRVILKPLPFVDLTISDQQNVEFNDDIDFDISVKQ
ncbi:hypothetical protein [Neptuniibacter sp.]